MSYISKNIKKIRGIKGLSQSAFADLFAIKRASVGAYEEERAEPRIAKVIEIAKHFGITLDDFLQKEITVNDLYRFDRLQEGLVLKQGSNVQKLRYRSSLCSVPYVSEYHRLDYFRQKGRTEAFSTLQLPLPEGEYCAFEIGDNLMSYGGEGWQKGDIAVVAPFAERPQECELHKPYLIELPQKWLLRRVKSCTPQELLLTADAPDSYVENYPVDSIVKIWRVVLRITNNISHNLSLRRELDDLRGKLATSGN